MRRRFLRWKVEDDDMHSIGVSSKSSRKRSRLGRLKKYLLKYRLSVIVAVILSSSWVVFEVHKTVLGIRRYSKENDPFYKSLRFGNASAVAELYEELNFTNRPLNPRIPVVFYNVYIPFGQDDAVIDIVKEQLGQVSRVSKENSNQPDMIVNLVTIGDEHHSQTIKELCDSFKGIQCQHRKHYESADEEATLQDLFDHCSANPVATSTVTYLHSKGTFHRNHVNDAWRRALTAAALHRDCWIHDICSVCGLQFYTQFALFWPGNMWTANCHYVSKLIPPQHFQRQLETAASDMLRLRLEGILGSRLLRDRSDYFGLDRYHAEHWIGSHPDLQPCDMEPLERPQDVFKRNRSIRDVASHLRFSLAPRHVGFPVGHNFEAHQALHDNERYRKKEIFLLPGKIVLWYKLYRRVPSDQAWVWRWFPDGAYWKSRVNVLGSEAIGAGSLEGLVRRTTITPLGRDLISTSAASGVIVFLGSLENQDDTRHQLHQMSEQTDSEWDVVLHFQGNGIGGKDSLNDLLIFCRALWTSCSLSVSATVATFLWDMAVDVADICKHRMKNSRVIVIRDRSRCSTSNASPSVCLEEFEYLLNSDADMVCSNNDCHRPSEHDFAMSCSLVRQLTPPDRFLKIVDVAMRAVLLASVRNETRWKADPTEVQSDIAEFLFDAWILMHSATPTKRCCCGPQASPLTYRDRILLLVVLLISEVIYNQEQALALPFCARHWKKLLELPPSYRWSDFIAQPDLQQLSRLSSDTLDNMDGERGSIMLN